MTDPEVLVTIQLRFPSIDRVALADHIAPVVTEALRAGGISTNVSVQGYDDDEVPDAS